MDSSDPDELEEAAAAAAAATAAGDFGLGGEEAAFKVKEDTPGTTSDSAVAGHSKWTQWKTSLAVFLVPTILM